MFQNFNWAGEWTKERRCPPGVHHAREPGQWQGKQLHKYKETHESGKKEKETYLKCVDVLAPVPSFIRRSLLSKVLLI
jgi:hypothetical protein